MAGNASGWPIPAWTCAKVEKARPSGSTPRSRKALKAARAPSTSPHRAKAPSTAVSMMTSAGTPSSAANCIMRATPSTSPPRAKALRTAVKVRAFGRTSPMDRSKSSARSASPCVACAWCQSRLVRQRQLRTNAKEHVHSETQSSHLRGLMVTLGPETKADVLQLPHNHKCDNRERAELVLWLSAWYHCVRDLCTTEPARAREPPNTN
mmetsp:Transcript_68116/g.156309  ORF Transcript_68116/g.156309 Transcript_68116/m.156309 type:complete len:208 (-) Transcript_68116:552-1175(-)